MLDPLALGDQVRADHRSEFQAALNAGTLDLRGRPGRHYVHIPPRPRLTSTLIMPDGCSIIGDGVDVTTIVFYCDPMGVDWAGIRVGNDWRITGVSLEVEEPGGDWDEQSHVLEVVGPVTKGEMSYCSIDHPLVPGSSRGDCIRFRGYSPSQTIWDQVCHHVDFRRSARSGVSIHSGLYGELLADGHSSTRFHHCKFTNIADQDLDCEGSGDIVGIECDHNEHLAGGNPQTSLSVSLASPLFSP